ncbi:hypothetical protein CsSME_00015768 [Camellia sinensis var. sinensis]
MFNNEQQGQYCTSIPRISFSNDFADAQQMIKHERSYREPPASSSDFEFSVSNYGMISAEELIVKGKLVPVKEHCSKMTTLRDELLVDDDDDDEYALPRLPKGGSYHWKQRLGLKRAHVVPKKADPNKTGISKNQSHSVSLLQELIDGLIDKEEAKQCGIFGHCLKERRVFSC